MWFVSSFYIYLNLKNSAFSFHSSWSCMLPQLHLAEITPARGPKQCGGVGSQCYGTQTDQVRNLHNCSMCRTVYQDPAPHRKEFTRLSQKDHDFTRPSCKSFLWASPKKKMHTSTSNAEHHQALNAGKIWTVSPQDLLTKACARLCKDT